MCVYTYNTDKYEEKYWLTEVSVEDDKRQDLCKLANKKNYY